MHYFDDNASFEEQYDGGGYHEPWVSYIMENDKVNYNKTEKEKEKEKPLTFNILSDGNIGWKIGSGSVGKTIQYSKNGGEWTSITSTTEGVNISVVAGDILKFRGNSWPAWAVTSYHKFSSTCDFSASGNPASLKYGENLTGKENIASACYYGLFENCTGLINPPVLPATNIEMNSYAYMFAGCTSLIKAPDLPSINLSSQCYDNMFQDCTSLTSAPALPATTLATSCYRNMFRGCTSLVTAPELPATTLADGCYIDMFYGCTGLTTAPELPATTLANYCYDSMFMRCRSLTQTPELPATTLVKRCYCDMFRNCSSLNEIKCLATDISAEDALKGWVISVPSTGTFYKKSGVEWPSGTSGIPKGWTVVEV